MILIYSLFVRYFFDVKDDKHRMETSLHIGNVLDLKFICEIWVSGFTLPLNVKLGNSGKLFFIRKTNEKKKNKEKKNDHWWLKIR